MPLRRMAGISPSYADGVLVCPTADKAVVALDLATRCLRWGYAYTDEESGPRQPQAAFFGPYQRLPDLDPFGPLDRFQRHRRRGPRPGDSWSIPTNCTV